MRTVPLLDTAIAYEELMSLMIIAYAENDANALKSGAQAMRVTTGMRRLVIDSQRLAWDRMKPDRRAQLRRYGLVEVGPDLRPDIRRGAQP